MNKKSKYAIIVSIILIILILFSFYYKRKADEKKVFEPYHKFEVSAIVSATSDEGTVRNILVIKDDKKNIKVTSDGIDFTGFIINGELKHVDEKTVYSYKLEEPYRNAVEIFSLCKTYEKIEERGDTATYNVILEAETINSLLNSLFCKKRTTLNTLAKMSIKNDKISSVNFTLSNIDEYKKIDITLKFKELSDDYTIDTSRVLGQFAANSWSSVDYEFKNTEKNVFEILSR